MTQITKYENPKLKQLSLFDLEKLEKKILDGERKAREGFIEIGTALQEIITRRGYLQRGCKNPEEYCEKHLKFSLRHGQRYIAAATAAKQIEKVTGETPRNEAAARVLTSIAADARTVKRVEAELKKGKVSFATATAERIQEVVAQVTGKAAPIKAKGETAKNGRAEFSNLYAVTDARDNAKEECPRCHQVPETYRRVLRQDLKPTWRCGNCNNAVWLHVGALRDAKHCPKCRASVGARDDFCGRCGEVLQGAR